MQTDGTPDNNDRVEIGPPATVFAEWLELGLIPPNLEKMRAFRLARVAEQLQKRDYAGVLLFDLLNIRYTCDSTNMQVWTLHNFSRVLFVSASGHVVLWDYHAGNIKRGGEWLETRIFNSGPRTNPWMQECGPRVIGDGELVSLDTDMVGPYAMCADLSRSWVCGDKAPTDEMRHACHVAHEHVESNMMLLAPGVALRDLTFKGHEQPEEFVAQRYSVKMHGVGLCDEFPAIYYPEDYIEGAFDYVLEPGMTFFIVVYAGAVGSEVGIKIEQQVLVTETGYECLSHYPYDERLLA